MSTSAAATVILACGIALTVYGFIIMTTGRVMHARERVRPKPLGQGLLLLGLCFLTETTPVLAGGSPLVILIFSGAAFVPLMAAVAQLSTARQPRNS
jgi:hypothetical protein